MSRPPFAESPDQQEGRMLPGALLALLLGTSIVGADERNASEIAEPMANVACPGDLNQEADEEARYFQKWIADDLSWPWPIRRLDPANQGDRSEATIEEAHEIVDRILFSPLSTTDKDARSRLEFVLHERIQLIHRLCRLSDLQTQKLRLAGQGDAHRLFERIELLRDRLPRIVERGVTIEFAREMRDVYHLVRVGTIDEGSKFTKCLRKMLTRDQVVLYSQMREEATPVVRELLPELTR